jgi:hypothetical protein
VALEQIFFVFFGFPCQFSFHRLLHHHHHQSPGAGAIGRLVAGVPSALKSDLTTRVFIFFHFLPTKGDEPKNVE